MIKLKELLNESAKSDKLAKEINREIEIANDKVKLHFPPEKCCVYQNNKLI